MASDRKRVWTLAEWDQVLTTLKADRTVNAAEVELTTGGVLDLMLASRTGDGRPYFAEANFTDAKFIGWANFAGASFGNGASFADAKFLLGGSFSETKFGHSATFRRAKFSNDVDFMYATFCDEATFVAAQFGRRADFDSAIFGDRADFGRALFENEAVFGGATFGSTASFSSVKFRERPDFRHATFGSSARFISAEFDEGPDLRWAIFGDGADFSGVSLEGASLDDAWLGGSILSRARFDYRSSLEGARIFTFTDHDGSVKPRPSQLADVRWNGVQVSGIADWPVGPRDTRLGDDPFICWPRSARNWIADSRLWQRVRRVENTRLWQWMGRVENTRLWQWRGRVKNTSLWQWMRSTDKVGPTVGFDAQPDPTLIARLEAAKRECLTTAPQRLKDPRAIPFEPKPVDPKILLADAVRGYRQVSTLLESQGMSEVAREFDYRASQLSRRQRRWPDRFGLWVLDVLTGYGYRPIRVLVTYVITVGLFAMLYGWTQATKWADALPASLLAFHGRGLGTPVVSGHFAITLAAVEATIGVFIEALVVATIIRRLFRR